MSDKNQEYKKTEIGKLPSEWEIKSIGDIGEIITGSTPKITYDFIDKVQHLWVSPADMGNKKYIRDTVKKLNNSSFNKTRILPKGSILVTCIGSTIGKIGIAGDELSTNQQINSIVCSERYNNEYIYYVIDYNFNNYMRFISSQAVPIINKTTFSKFKIQIPRIEEQEKIAEILSTWDSAIEKQEQLIQKKKEFKKGLIQRLLRGEVRFNKDNGQSFPEWRKVKLGEYLIKHNEKSEFNNQYPVLTSSRKGIFLQSDYYAGNDVASDDTTGYNVVPRGYFTYRHMSDDLVFKFNINDIVDKGIVSTLYPVFTVKGIDSYFLKVKLNEGDEFKKFALTQKQGGSRTYMYFSKLESLQMNIPSLEEQEKISEVLKLADKEIELLQKELEALKLQKKGLMQRLLTGEVRVKV